MSYSSRHSNILTHTHALSQGGAGSNTRLGEGNVGHQIMRRMGWEGAGLGMAEQGIQEPVKGGEVRDKVDKYKVGK